MSNAPGRQPGLYDASQKLERVAPMTAAGTRIRHRDQANEWVAYSMVVLITFMVGNLGEKLYERRQGVVREFPPALVAALEMQKSGGRPEVNPITNTPRGPDDKAREKELQAQLAKSPDDLPTLKSLAAYYYETLQADAAIGVYQQILMQSPDDVAMMTDMAAMQFVQGEIALSSGVLPKDMDSNTGPVAAVATLMEATEVDHGYAPAWQMLGWAYTQIGQRQKAIDAYNHALEHLTSPTERHAMEAHLAKLQEQAAAPPGSPGSTTEINPLTGGPVQAREPEHEQILLDRVAATPTNPEPHLLLGHYYYDTFQPKEAIEHYEQYLKKGGTPEPGIQTDYATVLSIQNVSRAITLLQRVTTDYPDFVPAWNNLAYLLRNRGEDAGAIAALQSAYAHAPESERSRIAQTIQEWGGTTPGS